MVRCAFDRIAWVSVGQQPNLLEMQRSLFLQLTDEPMPIKDGSTIESQQQDLRAACKGKRFLVVLDDVWDRTHEKWLNCIDETSTSKLLVTTRIRGLMQGCEEVSLNLMAPGEAVDLLLRAGQIADADETCAAAAGKIAKLCGYLPLYLMICGGVILSYEGELEWQTELVEMLQFDRVEVLDEAVGDDTVGRLVDSSLNMLKDDTAAAIFKALAVLPEDVLVQLPVAQLICSTDPDVVAKGKVTALSMRRTLTALLNRNLLQGSITAAAQFFCI